MRYKKQFCSVLTYNEAGKEVQPRVRLWAHFASAGKPPILDINGLEKLPPVPKGCFRSVDVTYQTLAEGMKLSLAPRRTRKK